METQCKQEGQPTTGTSDGAPNIQTPSRAEYGLEGRFVLVGSAGTPAPGKRWVMSLLLSVLLLIALFPTPGLAQENSMVQHLREQRDAPFRMRIKFPCESANCSEAKSIFINRMRGLDRVFIVESTPEYTISVLLVDDETKSGRKIGAGASILVINHHGELLRGMWKVLTSDDEMFKNYSDADWKKHFHDSLVEVVFYAVFVGSEHEALGKRLAVAVDLEVLEPLRKQRDDFYERMKNIFKKK